MKSLFFEVLLKFVCFFGCNIVAYYTYMKARWFQDFAYVCVLYALFMFQAILQNTLPAGFLAPAGSSPAATAALTAWIVLEGLPLEDQSCRWMEPRNSSVFRVFTSSTPTNP